MPDFRLSAAEAADLAAFVRSRGNDTIPEAVGPGDAVRGQGRAAELGCASCHALDGVASPPVTSLATALAGGLDRGCMADGPGSRGTAPEFGFGADDLLALRVFAGTGLASLGRRCDAEYAARQVETRRCNACHALDGRAASWTEREHDEPGIASARPTEPPGVSQARPGLTWAGEKLRPGWLEGFLAGRLPSPRPWLAARMPVVREDVAALLARGLAAQHGYGAEDPTPPVADPVLVEVGRRLIEQQGGFGCVTCHAVGGRQPVAVFEVQGVDFAEAAARLRGDWYRRWMADPPRLEPAAKMPKYADDDGRTAFRDVLDGDAARQFDAIWHFLHGAAELR
jgi:mono/diheme cytochrome c family protein